MRKIAILQVMMQTRNRIENILEAGYISEEDIDFLKVILPDIENNSIREDLKDYIDSIS